MNCFMRLFVVLQSGLPFWNMLRILISECVEARSVELAEKILDDIFVAEVKCKTENVFVDHFTVDVFQINRRHQTSLLNYLILFEIIKKKYLAENMIVVELPPFSHHNISQLIKHLVGEMSWKGRPVVGYRIEVIRSVFAEVSCDIVGYCVLDALFRVNKGIWQEEVKNVDVMPLKTSIFS